MPEGQNRVERALMVELQNDARQGISIRLDGAARYPRRAIGSINVNEDVSYMRKPIHAAKQPDDRSDA